MCLEINLQALYNYFLDKDNFFKDDSHIFVDKLDGDLNMEWFSGTGAGWQHRNKHQNSCIITHKPTGIQCRSRQNSLEQTKLEIIKRV